MLMHNRLLPMLLLLLNTLPLALADTAATAPATPASTPASNPIALFYDVVQERLRADGEALLCEQPAYTACFDHDQATCMQAQAPNKAACLQAFADSRAKHADAGSRVPTFTFMRCMLEKHVAAADSAELATCTEQAQKSFTASPYSQRIEVLYALELSNQQIASDLCDQPTLFRCPSDDAASCKQRINQHKDNCKTTVKQAVLSAEQPVDESQAAQQYMSCLLIQNECE